MRHPLIDVPELVRLASGVEIIRIPNEIDVPFTPRVRALVDTAPFQRLRQISQLGLVSLVYPGATHSRFEHVLGVFHNALRYLWQLGKDERFAGLVSPHQAETLLAAALLHDLGHWPFCHPIEDMGLGELPPHEELAGRFLEEGGEIASVLRGQWGVDPQEVLEILAPTPGPANPKLRLLRSILSGPIDIDKMDYLERDSLHCGVPYGRNFDKQRLIQSLVLNAEGDGVAISSKGKTAAELMVFARYVMFSEVYWHHTVRAATAMFARAFHELRGRVHYAELFHATDRELIESLRGFAKGGPAETLVEGLFGARRGIYKRVLEATPRTHPEIFRGLAHRRFADLAGAAERIARGAAARWGVDVRACDVLIDAPPREKEIQFRVDIFHRKEGRYQPLDEASPIIASLAREQFDEYVKRVRVFARPDIARDLSGRADLPDLIREAIGTETAATGG
jgi:HD superfamily phosphohydrolase